MCLFIDCSTTSLATFALRFHFNGLYTENWTLGGDYSQVAQSSESYVCVYVCVCVDGQMKAKQVDKA